MTSPASVTGDERLRLFLALRLPEPALDLLEAWQSLHVGGGRPVRRANLHVTLAFLGHRPESELPVILRAFREAVRRARRPAFTLLRSGRRCRSSARRLRPTRLLSCLDCRLPGRSTRFSKPLR